MSGAIGWAGCGASTKPPAASVTTPAWPTEVSGSGRFRLRVVMVPFWAQTTAWVPSTIRPVPLGIAMGL